MKRLVDEDDWWTKFWEKSAEQMGCSNCPFEDECDPDDSADDGRSCGQVLADIFLKHYTEGNYEWR